VAAGHRRIQLTASAVPLRHFLSEPHPAPAGLKKPSSKRPGETLEDDSRREHQTGRGAAHDVGGQLRAVRGGSAD
jgi:hypothetical protein